MPSTLVIAKRELAGLFYSPVAYLVLAVFAFVTALFFWPLLSPGQLASMRSMMSTTVWLMVFVVPALSMRSFAEEVRTGSIELLMTSPVSDAQLVVGKWLGSLVFLVVLLLPMVLQAVVMGVFSDPDWGPIATGLVGLALVGGLYLAIGVFVSALTGSQLIALLITILITGLLTIGLYALSGAQWLPTWLRPAVVYLNVDQQYRDFAKGLIDTSNFVYFVSLAGLFLFLAVRAVESRRWR